MSISSYLHNLLKVSIYTPIQDSDLQRENTKKEYIICKTNQMKGGIIHEFKRNKEYRILKVCRFTG